MPPITRLPFKPEALAIYNPSAVTTFAALTPDQTTAYSVAVSRNFKPYRDSKVYFTTGLPTGITVSPVVITGTALGGWTATYSLYNGTSNTITPASQVVILWQ